MRRKGSFGPRCKKTHKRGIRIETKLKKKTSRMKIAKKHISATVTKKRSKILNVLFFFVILILM
jgi:hypothetical protein